MAKLLNIGDLYGYDAGYVELRGHKGKPEYLLLVFILKGGPDDEHKLKVGLYPDGAIETMDCDQMGYLWRIWDGFPGEQIKETEWLPF